MQDERMKKFEQCENCVYSDKVFANSDCSKCEQGEKQLTNEDFEADMDFWCGDYDYYPPKREEEKLKYFPIRWLINLLLKYNSEEVSIWFNGIVFQPKGEATKQPESVLPLWLEIFFPFVYVWQYRDGGYTGDDFAGVLYYRLLPFIWLEFGYEC